MAFCPATPSCGGYELFCIELDLSDPTFEMGKQREKFQTSFLRASSPVYKETSISQVFFLGSKGLYFLEGHLPRELQSSYLFNFANVGSSV